MAKAKKAWVIVAGGRGTRMGAGLPKQYRPLNGLPILIHSLRALRVAWPDSLVQIVIHADDVEMAHAALAHLTLAEQIGILPFVFGGATRQLSVRNGLLALRDHLNENALIGIHDAARPFVSKNLIAGMMAALGNADGIVPALPLTDTIKQINTDGSIATTINRHQLRRVQTPQIFHAAALYAAHEHAFAQNMDQLTDDAAVAENMGLAILCAQGESDNIKITTEDDMIMAQNILTVSCPDIRMGHGYDVHAFGEGDHVWLGGVRIAHHHGLVGHSDADVLLHAICDAIYGALADGDIGSHFPPSDLQWKGASSDQFLRHAMSRVAQRGGCVAHIDGTLICEEPKIGPHRDTIRARIAAITALPLDRIALKATTSEQLGFTGRKEGIACHALVTLRLPLSP